MLRDMAAHSPLMESGTSPTHMRPRGRRCAILAIIAGLLGPFSLGIGPLIGILLGSVAVVLNRKATRDPRIEKLAVTGILTSVICLPLSFLAFLSRG